MAWFECEKKYGYAVASLTNVSACRLKGIHIEPLSIIPRSCTGTHVLSALTVGSPIYYVSFA